MKRPVRVTLFNHKGGVGKTTLTVNIAFALAEMGKSVLLVDSDPQCNLTSYLLDDEVVDELLQGSGKSNGQTLWTAVSPYVEHTGVRRFVKPMEIGDLKLVPGDIKLSNFEEFLYDAWTDSLKRRPGALRAITSISTLIDDVHSESHLDFVFYDTGPNVGPLNRVLLLDSDFFIVPVACDLFSVRALTTLGQTLSEWLNDAETIAAIAPANVNLLRSTPIFLGYIPQRFKVYGKQMTSVALSYLRELTNRVRLDVSEKLREHDEELAPPPSRDLQLGEVKDIAALVLSAQREGVSVWECSSGTPSQRNKAKREFRAIASHIVNAVEER